MTSDIGFWSALINVHAGVQSDSLRGTLEAESLQFSVD